MTSSGSCDFCDEFFHRKQDYYEHANIEHYDIVSEIWEGCHSCEKFFPTKMSLRKHKVRFHSRKKANPKSSAPTDDAVSTSATDSVNSQTCPFCLTHFPRIAHYYSHANAVHRELIESTWSACPDCDKLFPSRRIRDRHRQGFRKRGELCTNAKNILDDVAAVDVPYEEEEPEQYLDQEVEPEYIEEESLAGAHFLAGSSTFGGIASLVSNGNNGEEEEEEVYELEDEDPAGNEEETSSGLFARRQKSSCPFCGEEFALRRDCYNHAHVVHPRQVAATWKRCPKCPKYYPTQRALKNHIPKCTGPKNSEVRQEDDSLDPLQLMDDMSYPDAASMMTDEDVMSEAEPKGRFNLVEETTVNGRVRIKCQFCRQLLSRKQDYYEHCNASHLREIALTWVACKKCYRFYPTRKIVRNHLENTHRKSNNNNAAQGSAAVEDDDALLLDDDDEDIEATPPPPPLLSVAKPKLLSGPPPLKRAGAKVTITPVVATPPPPPKLKMSSGPPPLKAAKLTIFSTLASQPSSLNAPKASASSTPIGPQTTQCNFCHLMLSRKQDYYNHCHLHHLPQIMAKWHGCSVCRRLYPTKTALTNHRNKAHKSGDEGLLPSTSFSGPLSNINNNNNNIGDACDFCDERFTRKEDFYRHANDLHLDIIEDTWAACSECGKFFPNQEIADRHRDGFKLRGDSCLLRAATVGTKSSVSDVVLLDEDFDEDTMDDEGLLEADIAAGEGWINCDFCDDVFDGSTEFFAHVNNCHLDIVQTSWTPCSTCRMFFPSVEDADEHNRLGQCKRAKVSSSQKSAARSSGQSSTSKTSEDSGTVVDEVNDGKVRCPFCDRTFGKEQYYYRHVNDKHRKDVEKTWCPCQGCGVLFPNKIICFEHMKRAKRRGTNCALGGQSSCDICDLQFIQRSAYYKHVNDQHKDVIAESWFECDECNRFYPTRSVLSGHKQWFRTANKSCSLAGHVSAEDSDQVQSCQICKIEFPIGLLGQHLLNVHGISTDDYDDDDQMVEEDTNWMPDEEEYNEETQWSHGESEDEIFEPKIEVTNDEVETLEDE